MKNKKRLGLTLCVAIITSPEVKLKKGKYEYFCPLNPTPRYSLVVTE